MNNHASAPDPRFRRRGRLLPIGLLACAGAISGGIFLAVRNSLPAEVSPDPGRIHVGSAGISLVLPAGWAIREPEADTLLDIRPADPTLRIAVEGAATSYGSDPPKTLEDVEAMAKAVPLGSDGFRKTLATAVDRKALPIGPAVRVRIASQTSFILVFNQATTAYWFFVDGKLLILEYDERYPEDELAPLPGAVDPDALRTVLESLRIDGGGSPSA